MASDSKGEARSSSTVALLCLEYRNGSRKVRGNAATATPTQKRETRIQIWRGSARAAHERRPGLCVVSLPSRVTKFWQFRNFPSPHSSHTLTSEGVLALFALRCFTLQDMRKGNQHRVNEKIRKDARLQKLVKKAKKRAVQGGTPAAGT
jgi:hypothetical protein